MIPKIIHYCWFGGSSIPKEYTNYIKEWAALHPDWQIMRWDEKNMAVDHKYVQQSISKGNWANVSNYVRLKILKQYGGIYLDTDVKLLSGFDDYRSYRCFLGFEEGSASSDVFWVNNAVLGAEANHPFISKCISELESSFDGSEPANESSPKLTTHVLKQQYGLRNYGTQSLQDGIQLFSKEVFYPIPWHEGKKLRDYENHITPATVAVHMWGRTWYTREMMIRIIDDLQSWSKEQAEYIKKLESSVAALQENEKKMQLLLEEKETAIIQLLSKERQLAEQEINSRNEIALLTQQVAEKIEQLHILRDNYTRQQELANTLLAERQQRIDFVEQLVANLTGEVNDYKQKLVHCEEQLAEQQAMVQQKTRALDIAGEQLKYLTQSSEEKIAFYQEKMAAAEKNLQEKQLQLAALNELFVKEQQGWLKQGEEYRQRLLLLDKSVADKESHIQQLQSELNTGADSLLQLNNSLHILAVSAKKKEEIIADLQVRNNELKEEISNLKAELQVLSGKYNHALEQVAGKEEAIAWYQRTFEHRSLPGVIKQKLFK